jgi:hypothetical protein
VIESAQLRGLRVFDVFPETHKLDKEVIFALQRTIPESRANPPREPTPLIGLLEISHSAF